jgi:hypothetical protein
MLNQLLSKKTKTVSGVCDAFTQDLEEIRELQQAEQTKLATQIANLNTKHETATKEVVEATNAIANIRNMFRGNTTQTQEEV